MDAFTVLENTYYLINRNFDFYKNNFGHAYYVNVHDEETYFIDKLFKGVENKLTPSDKMHELCGFINIYIGSCFGGIP